MTTEHAHRRVVCPLCETVIMECRCIGPNKRTVYERCSECQRTTRAPAGVKRRPGAHHDPQPLEPAGPLTYDTELRWAIDIADFIANGGCPTITALAKVFGLRSKSATHSRLHRLRQAGLIDWDDRHDATVHVTFPPIRSTTWTPLHPSPPPPATPMAPPRFEPPWPQGPPSGPRTTPLV